jgi:acetyl esterase/lipase
MATEFAMRGYVCFSINYRVRSNPKDDKTGTMSDAMEDAMSGLDWVRDHSAEYDIDSSRIIIGGGSAGGMLAVNLCYKDHSGADPWDKSGIIGLVNLWGSPDSTYRMSTIDSEDPPTIIVHGTADETVPFSNTEQLATELERAGVKHEVVPILRAGHTPASHMEMFNKNISVFLFNLL